jgi:hypothetical protein
MCLQALATYHEALKQDPQSADIAGKIESLTQLVREKSHTMLQQYLTGSQRKSMDPNLQQHLRTSSWMW